VTTARVNSGEKLTIEFAGKHEPHILRIHSEQKPASIRLDGRALAEGDAWRFDAGDQRLIIKTREYGQGTYVISR